MSAKAVPDLPLQTPSGDFVSLEEKVYRTIELLKTAREAKAAAERDVARIREQLDLREEEVESLRGEVIALRKEREDVKSRVEKILRQIDEITEEAAH